MKINLNDLKKLYQAYIRQKVPLSRENCPKTEDIVNCFNSQFSKRKKTKILDHMTNCVHCSQELDFILHILRGKKILLNEIDVLLKGEERAKVSAKKTCFKRLSWSLAPILFGAAVVVFGVVILTKNSLFFEQGKRGFGGIIDKIILLEPLGQITSSFPVLFRWHEAKASDYYTLEIYDETLNPIWKSPKIRSMRLVIPPAILGQLGKNRDYYWMITSFQNNEKHNESPLQRFLLKEELNPN